MSPVGQFALRDVDLVDLILAGSQTLDRTVVSLFDSVNLSQLTEHFVHPEQRRTLKATAVEIGQNPTD